MTGNAAEVSRDMVLLGEVEGLLPDLLGKAKEPAGKEGVKHVIGRRFALYPQPDRSDGEWAAWWADYCDVLEDLPRPALEAAMRSWVSGADAEFLPKPGKLREIALTSRTQEGGMYDTARQALRLRLIELNSTPGDGIEVPPVGHREIPRGPTEADKARVRAWAREFVASVEAKHPKAATIRPNRGAVDEGGITLELRTLIEKQRAESA